MGECAVRERETEKKRESSSPPHSHTPSPLQLDPGESKDVHIPIVFTRKGRVEVEVIGSTMMQKDSDSVVIDVNPEVRLWKGERG